MQKIIPTILLKQLEQLDEEICFTNSAKERETKKRQFCGDDGLSR
jgi:hypothetical protein